MLTVPFCMPLLAPTEGSGVGREAHELARVEDVDDRHLRRPGRVAAARAEAHLEVVLHLLLLAVVLAVLAVRVAAAAAVLQIIRHVAALVVRGTVEDLLLVLVLRTQPTIVRPL